MRKTKTLERISFVAVSFLLLESCKKENDAVSGQQPAKSQNVKIGNGGSGFASQTELGDEHSRKIPEYSGTSLRPKLKGTGIKVPEPEIPDYAVAVVARIEEEIGEFKSDDPRLEPAIHRLARGAVSNFGVDAPNSADSLLNDAGSEDFVTGLRSGNVDFLNGETEHEAAFMLFSIASNQSLTGKNAWIDFLIDQSERVTPTKSDAVVAHLTNEAFSFSSQGDVQSLITLSTSRNPIYRQLAANLAQRSSLEPSKLVSFYENFSDEDTPSVNEAVIAGLRKSNSKSALMQLKKLVENPRVREDEGLKELASEAIDYLSQRP